MMEKNALQKVMAEVLVNASTSYSVNDTSRKSGVSVFAAKHALDYLHGNGMVTLQKIGRTYQYRADLGSYMARGWKLLFTLEELRHGSVVENLLGQARGISCILLYGSAAVGRDDEHSDLDLLVITDAGPDAKKRLLAQARGTRREINIQVYTMAQWRRKAASAKAFYDTVVVDSIALFGQKPVVL